MNHNRVKNRDWINLTGAKIKKNVSNNTNRIMSASENPAPKCILDSIWKSLIVSFRQNNSEHFCNSFAVHSSPPVANIICSSLHSLQKHFLCTSSRSDNMKTEKMPTKIERVNDLSPLFLKLWFSTRLTKEVYLNTFPRFLRMYYCL